MESPCLSCHRRDKDKNAPECTRCEKRDAYVEGLAGPGSLGADQTNLTGKMHGHSGHQVGKPNMKAEPKKVGIKNPEHGEFIERRCAELNVRVEGVLNTNTKLQEYVDARAIIFVEMMEQFNLTQSAMIIIWDVSRFTAVNWQKRYAKLKASPRAVVKTKTPSESPEQALAVLFADHPKVLEQIKTLAQYEMRTLGDQVIYMAKSYIESTLEMMLKVKAVLEEK